MFGISVCRDHQLEYRFWTFRILVPTNRDETTWMAKLTSLPLSRYCADHSQLSRASFSVDECFTASRNDSSPTIQCILCFQNLFVSYRKQTFTFSIIFEAISLFLNVGVSSVLGTKQALHTGSGFRRLWLFSRYQTITNIETILTV
jgi:hypothetical protein